MLAFNLLCPIKYLKPDNFTETNTKYRWQQHSASGLSLWLSLTHSRGFGEDKGTTLLIYAYFQHFIVKENILVGDGLDVSNIQFSKPLNVLRIHSFMD